MSSSWRLWLVIGLLAGCQRAAAPDPVPDPAPLATPLAAPPERRPNTPPLDLYAPLPPDAAALRDLAHVVCGERNVAVVDDRPRCELCPQQTGRAGQEAGELFVRMERDRALVELMGCEPELYTYGGGTFSLRHAADGWHQLDYWPQVLMRDCEARWFMGAPTLWCTGDYARQGIVYQQLWLVRLEEGRDPAPEWAPTIECDIAGCPTEVAECYDEGQWGQADLDNDGVAELLWDGTYTRWTPIDGADLSQCPPREPPHFTVETRPAARGWRHGTDGWIEVVR